MNRDNYRDYVVDAYRYYALCGRPDSIQLRQLRNVLPQNCRGGLADLEAVQRVLQRLELEPDAELWKRCLDIVYFSNPRRSTTRGAMSDRVHFASMELCISESTVYRMMRRLRMLLAMERGLRIDERELTKMSGTFATAARSGAASRERGEWFVPAGAESPAACPP